ncbi:16S rRNA (cytidine(1402)-2'-O)-methyltransferase [Fundidesulfovibrio terrae]|uniref:16S rRNA (cytidine(1402)-2'-O)-methyltransferase n=1 Tax=Fundidesulfovibrio terrae TaxID=2922866 RepID=UPI001FAFF76B|nr:16S rRNA (cytidine(1402)-2'-O)-methyltransferase [Fundidesulfovibrio terrae]
MSDARGTLWVVATPLGNAQDLAPRSRDILARAALVLCEDTRRTARLFAQQGIAPGRFLSMHDHNEEGRVPQVLGLLAGGAEIALVSDAGTPVLSDPGYLLVRACREAGHAVRPAPGPSAVMAALCASGLAPQPFVFLGFLPRKSGDIRQALARFAQAGCTLVFFERKDRLGKSLAVALEVLGERECVIARELTKTHEEFLPGRLSDFAGKELELLGEITVVVGPALEAAVSGEGDVRSVLAAEMAAGGKPKDVARRAAARLRGVTVKELYELILEGQGRAHG